MKRLQNLLMIPVVACLFTGCSKSEPTSGPSPGATGTPAALGPAPATGAEETSTFTNTVRGEINSTIEVTRSPSVQTLIERAAALIQERKYADAGTILQALRQRTLTPEQSMKLAAMVNEIQQASGKSNSTVSNALNLIKK